MKQWRWFLPGLNIKRWVAIIIAGVLIFSLGMVFVIGKNIPRGFYFFITSYVRQGVFGISLSIIGIALFIYGLRRLNKRILKLFMPGDDSLLIDMLYRDMILGKGLKIVVIGGGTGLHSLLRGLKKYSSNISAIVTVSDDGGSSGRLRDELNILPPGDVRQCIAALADSETAVAELFSCRFESTGSLKGHSVGNLLLAAMTELKGGDFYQAVKELSKVLAVRGRVLPSTLERVTLCAEMKDGTIIRGESSITSSPAAVSRVFLSPADGRALPEAVEAIMDADLVVIGPGSLFTSIIPNLLVKDLLQPLRRTPAPKVYVCNVMSQPGETDGYSASDHAAQIVKLLGKKSIDYIVLNNKYPSRLLAKYRAEGAEPVEVDRENLERLGISRLVMEDLISEEQLVRHDPDKLAACIMKIARETSPDSVQNILLYDVEKFRERLMQIGI